MLAITALKGLFGPSAYRVYAGAIGRCPTTFSRNISDRTTVTNRLVLTTCALLDHAKAIGIEPTAILQQYSSMNVPQMARKSWLHSTFEDLFGTEALERDPIHVDGRRNTGTAKARCAVRTALPPHCSDTACLARQRPRSTTYSASFRPRSIPSGGLDHG